MLQKVNNLEEKLELRIKRYYHVLQTNYDNRISKARDSVYAHSKYIEDMKYYVYDFVADEDFATYREIIYILDDAYKCGNSIKLAIYSLYTELNTPHDEYVEVIYNHKETWIKNPNPSSIINTKYHSFSTEAFLNLFAKHKAFMRFWNFLIAEKKQLKEERLLPENAKDAEKEKLSFTTARQAMFIKLILDALGVKNIDKSKIAYAARFLTGKNDSNMYDKIRNTYALSDNYTEKDLRFVRDILEDLKLYDIVDIITKEIRYSS